MGVGTEAQKYVWEGAIPLQIRLHESEITTHPPPPPALILGPRLGYLPLLVHLVKPYFSDTLPPGADTIWFEYKGLPLKWYIPTGVLFDLLCVEPERPWNLTVHFRGYPGDVLSPCDGEDSVKWSFINSLKEAAYIINGNCKNVMNMSQSDQLELWRSLVNGKMEGYLRISSKLKLGTVGEEGTATVTSCSTQPRQIISETDTSGPSRTGRIPVRLYVRNVGEDVDDFEDATTVNNWDTISYINRPVEIHGEDGKIFTLCDALKILLPEFFEADPSIDELSTMENEESTKTTLQEQDSENASNSSCKEAKETPDECHLGSSCPPRKTEILLVRIQGIEPKFDIPFTWLVKNLTNPDHFLHLSVFVRVSLDLADSR